MNVGFSLGLDLTTYRSSQVGVKVVTDNLVPRLLDYAQRDRDWISRLVVFVSSTERSSTLRDTGVSGFMQQNEDLDIEIRELQIGDRHGLSALVARQVAMALSARELDLVHCFDYAIAYTSARRALATIHDLNYLTNPHSFTLRQRCVRAVLVPASIRAARHIVTISNTMRDEIVRVFPAAEEKITVIPNGAGSVTREATNAPETRRFTDQSRPGKLMLAVGTLRPHKNYVRLVQALAYIDSDVHLTIVGRDDGLRGTLERIAEESGVSQRVDFLGTVSDEDLLHLYKEADALIAPSLYEGFGIPVLEAMTWGVPCVVSDIPIFREVTGDQAVFFDPRSSKAIAAGINNVIDDTGLAAHLATEGPLQASRYSWDSSAEALWGILKQLAAERETT
jgi:glycosyltransferase involved in cell wall biosynthesis